MPSVETASQSRVSRRGAVTKPTSTPRPSSRRPSTDSRAQTQARAEHLLKRPQEDEPKNLAKPSNTPRHDTAGKKAKATTKDNDTRPPSTPKPKPKPKPEPKTPPHNNSNSKSNSHTRSASKNATSGDEEKRLRKFRPKPPGSFLTKLTRAQTQRMIVLHRQRGRTAYGAPYEEIDIVGSTGNIYQVTVGREPRCTCPDAAKGNECKHKVYALHTVLKAPEHLQYQLALLPSELEVIFAHAPPLPTDLGAGAGANAGANDGDDDDDGGNTKGKRKPPDGECPICYMDLDQDHNLLVWCKAQCGHNLHQSCFDQWAASQAGRLVTCVYCRSPWEVDVGDAAAVKAAGHYSAEGYINVAEQFGLSRARDYSGYYQPWARRQFGYGW